jgi:hypothetical protein
MSIWYLSDGTNTLDLGTESVQFKRGGSKRDYTTTKYIGSNGGYINGSGRYEEKKFVVTFQFRAENGQATYLNQTRDDIIEWFSGNNPLYLYEVTSNISPITRYTRVYCTDQSDETIDYVRGLIKKTFTSISPSGVFVSTSEITESVTLSGSSSYIKTFTNNGIDCPFKMRFTPVADQSYIRVEMYNGIGFKFTKLYFSANTLVEYNTANNELTIGGVAVNTSSYMTAGKPFLLKSGVNNIYVQSSGAATVQLLYNELYI